MVREILVYVLFGFVAIRRIHSLEKQTSFKLLSNADSVSEHNSDNVGQNSDNVGQNSDNVGQNSDNVGQNSDNVGQNSDNVGHNSDNVGQNSDNVGQNSDNVGQNSDTALWTGLVGSVISCAVVCSSNMHCVLFKYHHGKCSTFSDLHTKIAVIQDEASLFYLVPETSGTVGDACTGAHECKVSNSTCNDGKCRCQLGFSFTEGINTCTIGCTRYGASYSYHKNTAISGHNINHRGTSSIGECERQCVQSQQLCISIDYRFDGMCGMQGVGWFDVSPSAREIHTSQYMLLVRNCEPQT